MKKFKFRLETLKKQRKVAQDLAQREYAEAQKAVQDQLGHIQAMYESSDKTRMDNEQLQFQGGACADRLRMNEEYIEGLKIKIQRARQKARELMQVAEEKLEILSEKRKDLKILEKLKENREAEHKKEYKKKEAKALDDITSMRIFHKE